MAKPDISKDLEDPVFVVDDPEQTKIVATLESLSCDSQSEVRLKCKYQMNLESVLHFSQSRIRIRSDL
jgi:hypothetical protein